MARKKGAEKDSREALLEAALAVVSEQGFEGASVDAIVKKAGLSKGTFFHFFPTKQDLLDAAAARVADQNWERLRPGLEAEGDPLEKLAAFLSDARRWRQAHATTVGTLWGALAQESNAQMRAGIRARQRELVAPVIARLLSQATAQGRCSVADPETTATLLMEMTAASSDGTLRLLRARGAAAIDQAVRRVNTTLEAVERIVGAAPGSFERVTAETLAPFAQPDPADPGRTP